MKSLVVTGVTLALATITGSSHAGESYGHGYTSPGIFYGSSFSGNYGNNYLAGYYGGGHRGRGYSSGYRYGYSSHGHGHGSSNNGWYFLGGALLGSLLTYSYNRSRYSNTYVSYPATSYYQPVRTVEKRIVYSAPVVHTTRAVDEFPRGQVARRLHRDLKGRCYEIKFNDSGDELRVELPPAECDWG